MKAPVSVCMIVRNEAPRILDCLESIRHYVAEIVVVDTGSQDGTFEVLAASGLVDRLERFHGCNEGGRADGVIEDFSMAREKSYSLATQPWTFWLDGDDVVRGAVNLADICRRYEAVPGPVLVMFPYEYARDHLGNVTCLHQRERLCRGKEAFGWMGPVHEVLMPKVPATVTVDNSVTVVHERTGKTEVPLRNLRILQKWIAKHGEQQDARMLYYTGLEYANSGDLGRSIEYHEKYVAKSGWDDEKCLSCLELCRHHMTLGNLDDAERWALRASSVCETWREPVFALGRVSYTRAKTSGLKRDWERAANHFRRGLAMPPTQTPLFVNPMEARYDVHLYQVVALSSMGHVEEALRSCEAALAASPGDANQTHNKHYFRTLLGKARAFEAIAELEQLGEVRADYGIPKNAAHYARMALEGKFSVVAKSDVPFEQAKLQAVPERAPATGGESKLQVVLFTGMAYERWSPETLERGGMGGSETMAWEMARRLVRLGHGVRVFGDCEGMEGNYEGVEWLDHRRYLEQGERAKCDVLISSRIPELVDFEFRARARVAWVHDVHMGPNLTNKRGLKFDRYLCLSQWHKRFFLETYKFLHESSVVVTRNGIDLSRYEGSEARDPHRMIYSSSPDRGLLAAIQCLPGIRARVPDASLHVYYGFENWEKSDNPDQRANAQVIKGMLGAYANFGAVNHGRVSGKRLAREQMKSGVWCYPTWFCCHPDTRISVPGNHRGGAPTVRIEDMVGKTGFPVYAFNEKENRFQIATCNKVWMTKVAEELVAIRLDDGQLLRVTPDHLVLTFDGEWVQAGSLKPGDSLRALHYRYNVAIRDANGRWPSESRLVGEWIAGRSLRKDEHVNHLDLERLDNTPEMLEVLGVSEHFSKTHKGRKQSRKHEQKRTAAWKEYWDSLTPEQRSAHGTRAGLASWKKLKALPPEQYQAWLKARAERKRETMASRVGKNHQVISVTKIPGGAVYDMEVEGLHNFVADGVVVHNCETSCLTAMEAQAAGLRIVSSPIGALNETAGPEHAYLVEGDWLSPQYQQEFTERAVACLLHGEVATEPRMDRARQQARARQDFGLDELAADWCGMLQRFCTEVERDVVPRYRAAGE